VLLRLLTTWVLLLCTAVSLNAADPTFVGILSLALEENVAQELAITPVVKEQLLKLIDQREADALELAVELKGLSATEQRAKLAPFVAESERLGLALLSQSQQQRLMQLRVARQGMQTLLETSTADKLGLSDNQKLQAQAIQTEWEAKLKSGTDDERRLAKAEMERSLAQLLTKEQRIAWDVLAGNVVATTPLETPKDNNAPPPPVEDKVVTNPKPVPVVPTKEIVAEQPAAVPALTGDQKIRFSFRFTPWKDVLDWFAQQADFSLILDAPPPGTFNYTDNRLYTPAEAIDLLNSVLLTKGYTLVRRDRMLLVINLEDGIPPNLVQQVSVAELDKKGEYELVSSLFPLGKFAPEDADKEIRPLLGPQGSMLVLPKAKQIYVTETAGKLRTIRDIIRGIEDPSLDMNDKVVVLKLKHILPSDLMLTMRPLMGMPEGVNATPDGSLRLAPDELSGRIFATGKPEKIAKLQDLVQVLDTPPEESLTPATAIETPQLEVYTITTADTDAVLQVLRTLLGGSVDVRLDKDAKTGNIVALARPSEHATIKATIEQMQKDTRQVEVIKLRKLDPQVAVIAINKLFGGDTETPSPSAPKVDADPNTLQLLVRGSESQIEQIRELLGKMGEVSIDETASNFERSNVRTIPLTGRAATSALEQMQSLWPTLHSNKIRAITPSKPSGRVPLPSPSSAQPANDFPFDMFDLPKKPTVPKTESSSVPVQPKLDKAAGKLQTSPFQFVAWQQGQSEVETVEKPKAESQTTTPMATAAPSKQKTVPGAEIVVTVGPGGLIIASEDLDALDAFESLMQQIASNTQASGKEYTVFYLRYAKADAAVELIQQAIGGGGGSSEEGGGGNLMGDLASSLFGGQGGMFGSLMGMGSSSGTSSGPVTMTADARLNAILCYGKPNDLDLVEQLLKVVDQESSPEDVQTSARPRFIPVQNADAEEIVGVVKQLYASRLQGDTNQQRQPSPEEFIRALRGGGGGGRSSQAKKQEEAKITVGVDKRSNSVIVSAPEPLFEEIKALVEHLDIATSTKDETVRVVSLHGANPALVEKALNSMVGNVTISRQSGGSTGSSSNRSSSSATPPRTPESFQPSPEQIQDDIRRRIETFNQLQQELGGRNRPGSGDSRSPRGGR
jgi:type II secretory pathway component GspD/PulD (secretin)